MKAAVFTAAGAPLEIAEVADPEPGPHEVILRVCRCGICGSDLHATEPGSGRSARSGSVLGHEVSGEVVAAGREVTLLEVGDRVAALPIIGCGRCAACLSGDPAWCVEGLRYIAGGYAQYTRASERGCLVLPGGLSLSDGALVEPLAVGVHGVRMTPRVSGARCTVIGAGPIGLAVVFWLRRFGAAHIEVIEGNPSRAGMAMAMGADATRAPAPPSDDPRLPPDRNGPAFVFECVGRPGLLAAAVAMVRPRGTVVSLGFCMVPEPFLSSLAGTREVTMIFPTFYSVDDYQITIDALNSGAVEPRAIITDVIGFAALPEAFEALRRPSRQCKVMIDPWLDG